MAVFSGGGCFFGALGTIGVIFGGLGDLWGCLWEAFGGHVEGVWWLLAVFCGGCVVKRETVKSVVLLNEIDVFKGAGGAGWSYFLYFLLFDCVWKLVGNCKRL